MIGDDTDFGDVITDKTITYTIQNTGLAALNISSIVVTGANAGDFVVSNITIPNSIATSGDITFDVTFTPSATGVRNAIITINNDDCDEDIYNFAIRGTAAPEINVQGNGNDIVDGAVSTSSTNHTDFEFVPECNANTEVKTFTIQNTGSGILNITGIAVSGTNAGDFVVSSIPTTVAAAGSETFTITFNPSATGNRTATVSIANNDADENPYTFAINGNGTADITNPTITAPTNVTANTDTGLCTASGVALGTPTGSDNCGTPTFTNDATPPFAIGVTTVTWTADDGNGNTATATQTVTVTGAREINVQGNAVSIFDGDVTPSLADDTDFGSVATTRTITYTIQNTRTEVIAISSIVSSGANAADFVVSSVPTSVAAGGTATFDVTFTPSATGTRNATITVNNNDCNEAVYDFAVEGIQSALPEINLQGNGNNIVDGAATTNVTNDTDFGDVVECLNSTKATNFTIQNTGTAVLNITGITVTGTNAADFVVSSIPTTVAASGSETFTITFNPSATGNRTATVSIANNDADENPYTFAINGNGTADITNPTITAPTNVTANTDTGLCTVSGVALGTPTGGDNCGTPTFTNDAPATFPIGVTTVTWTATDGNTNTATATQTVTVTGAREINVQGNAVSIVDGDVTPNAADNTNFGNTTSRIITYTIENTGTEVLAISSIVSSGANAADFVVSSVPTSVAAGGTATFDVTFTPSATGTRNATITINNNDCNEAVYDFAVEGSNNSSGDVLLVETGINYPTIQEAVDDAIAGNTIRPLSNRNYPENVVVDKNLFFNSTFTDYKDVNIDQIKVNDGIKLTITGNMSIVEMLYMEGNSEVEVSGITTDFALNSTDSATAMVVNESANTVVGNVIMERLTLDPTTISGFTGTYDGRGYHMFSSPFSNAPVSQFSDDMSLVVTPAYNASNDPAYVVPFSSFFRYDETRSAAPSISGYYSAFTMGYEVPLTSDNLEIGRGYEANLNTGTTVDLNGTLNNGTVTLPLSNTAMGYNLLGNPYPSPINWSTIYGLSSNVTPTISIDIKTGRYAANYATYNTLTGIGLNGGADDIASMQGFLVRAFGGGGQVVMDNTVRPTTYQDTRFFKTQKTEVAKEGVIKLAISSEGNMDETAIGFIDGATSSFDNLYDAEKIHKINGYVSTLYSYNENASTNTNEYYAINILPKFDEDMILPLAMNIVKSGKHKIVVREIKYFHSLSNVYLYDSLTETLHDLKANPEYEFVAQANKEVKRFVLLFKTNQNFTKKDHIVVYPNPTPNNFSYSLKNDREGIQTIRLFDATGRLILERNEDKEGSFLEGIISLEKESSGLYLLQISDSKSTTNVRIIKE